MSKRWKWVAVILVILIAAAGIGGFIFLRSMQSMMEGKVELSEPHTQHGRVQYSLRRFQD